LENSTLNRDVVIGPGTIIGSEDTLLFRRGSSSEKVLSAGGVLIGEKVEIHANCSVSRAIFGGNTIISAGTKFDNLIDIGQNAKIGERCFLAACASIGADVEMGKEVWIGPNSTVSDGVTLGDSSFVTIGSVVVEDVGPNQKVTGNYAIDHAKFIEFLKKIR
jgi:UDP-3-O-[3-hydroxymyristoyl] glucosamine N-acyltransferase